MSRSIFRSIFSGSKFRFQEREAFVRKGIIKLVRRMSSTSGPYPSISEGLCVGSNKVILETGWVAQYARCSAMMSIDGMRTSMLSTVCTIYEPENRVMVDYIVEPFSRGGSQRNWKHSYTLIKESIGSKIPKKDNTTIQVTTTALSVSGHIDEDIAAVNVTSTAMALSGLRWGGPVGAVRIGMIDGKLVVNSVAHMHPLCEFELTYVCARDGVIMVDFDIKKDGYAITEENKKDALKLAYSEAKELIDGQKRLSERNEEAKQNRDRLMNSKLPKKLENFPSS